MTGKFTLPDIREHFGDNEEEMQPQHSMFTVHFFKKKHKDNRKNRKEEHTFHYLIQIVSLGDKRQDI